MELTVEELEQLLDRETRKVADKRTGEFIRMKEELYRVKQENEELHKIVAAAYKDPNMVQKEAMVATLQNECGQTFSLYEAQQLVDKLVKVGWPE